MRAGGAVDGYQICSGRTRTAHALAFAERDNLLGFERPHCLNLGPYAHHSFQRSSDVRGADEARLADVFHGVVFRITVLSGCLNLRELTCACVRGRKS